MMDVSIPVRAAGLPPVSRSSSCLARAMISWLAILVFGYSVFCRAGFADQVATDANIVTGLDISNSIDLDYMKIEIAGLAQAIRDPQVLQAIKAGPHHRVGFAVFAWHHDQFPTVVSWTLIDSDRAALAVSQAIEARQLVDVELEGREQVAWYIGRLTDLSQAIDHANELLRTAPFAGTRSVVNIIGNGEDNVGEDAGFARDRVVAAGGTVNGVVLGSDETALEYYRQQVVGGLGSFVMSTGDAATLTQVMIRKFLHDIIATR